MGGEGEELLRELLEAPDRDASPGARPLLAYREGDERTYLDAVDAHATRRVRLVRRGSDHGEVAELEESCAPRDPFPLEARLQQRWHEAKPIVLRGLVPAAIGAAIGAERDALFDQLQEGGGLLAHLSGIDWPPGYGLGSPLPLEDAERDLEKHALTAEQAGQAPGARDLWAKSAWLSNDERDRSLRLRLSFGEEGADDASRDHGRHLRVSDVAQLVLPESRLLEDHEELRERLDTFVGEPTFLTQHIAYWNAPNGGARFHHDAFDETSDGGQLGVCYVQLSGTTAWLALSTNDLALRVLEVMEYLEEGELDWVRDALWPDAETFAKRLKVARALPRSKRELARPGCGMFGKLVDRGPEFTALLADAGHGFLLGPGDGVLLPNHGFARTCLHSVFCASDEQVAYGLSSAVRALEPPPAAPPPPADSEDRPPSRRQQRRRRRR